MTVYDDDINEIQFSQKKEDINTNVPLDKDDILYIVISVFSPYGRDIRTKLAQDFIHRIEKLQENGEPVQICVIELLYKEQNNFLKVKNSDFHLQIQYKHNIYLFNKENLINVGVKKILPFNWKWMAWIDADIEMTDVDWVRKTIQLFKSGNYDILQLFSICRYLSNENIPSEYFYGSIRLLHSPILLKNKKYRHPGFAWACSRKAYEKMNGLFEYAIVGGGDFIMEACFTNRFHLIEKKFKENENFLNEIKLFYENVKDFSVYYLNTIIQHYYHGERKNRMYVDRNEIILKNKFNPKKDMIRPFENIGFNILVPTLEFYEIIESKINSYFQSRKEIKNNR